MARTINDEIKKIGLKYCGHYDKSKIQLIGTAWSLDIPQDRVGEFAKLFPDVDWENSEFVECLKGRYIRVTFDDDMNLYSLHHITKAIDYMI